MRIWMEERAEEKDHFAAGVTLSIIGLTAAAIAVPCGIAVLTLILDGPVKEISMAACLGAVALVIFLAKEDRQQGPSILHSVLSGRRGRFFAVDVRKYVGCGRGVIGIYTDAFPRCRK